jgi:V/A-type H+-transporting ATPase subunit E
MEAEQVVGKILSEARAEGEKIISGAKTKAAAEQSKLESELAKYNKETETLAADAAEDKKARMLAMARMDVRKELGAAKVALVDEVFARARERIRNLGDEEYRKLISELMIKAIETGDEEVIVGRDEKRIDDKFIKQVNRQLGSGFRGNLRLSGERADILGGFILRRNNIQTNVSIEVMVDSMREEIESEVVKDLFSE